MAGMLQVPGTSQLERADQGDGPKQGVESVTTLYLVGPKGNPSPKHPWLMTGAQEVAEKYAQELGGEVTTKEIIAPPLRIPMSWHGDR